VDIKALLGHSTINTTPAHEAAPVDIEEIRPVCSPVYEWGHAREDDLARDYAARYMRAAGWTPDDLAAAE